MKLLIFAPCEKVIIDQAGNPSLIVIMSSVAVQPPSSQGQPIPANAVAPRDWFVFTDWLVEPQEVGKKFMQQLEIILPNKEVFGGRLALPFTPSTGNKIAQNNVSVRGFPVGQVGEIEIRVWIEENGSPITEIASFPLNIVRGTADQSPVTAS